MPTECAQATIARALGVALCVAVLAGVASAHPLAPGLLDLRERDDGTLRLLFKLPRTREPGVRLSPQLPVGCSAVSESSDVGQGVAFVRVQQIDCGEASLVGKTLGVEGIERSRAGVLARVQLAGAAAQSRMLTAAEPSLTIAAAPTARSVLQSFFSLGVEHLVTGVDHVLFLLVLTLLIGWGRRLFWTLTSFTVGHSVTLSLTVLGHVDYPVAFVESLIAFSIVVAACEIARPERPGWLVRRPGLVAGSFGLLHGIARVQPRHRGRPTAGGSGRARVFGAARRALPHSGSRATAAALRLRARQPGRGLVLAAPRRLAARSDSDPRLGAEGAQLCPATISC